MKARFSPLIALLMLLAGTTDALAQKLDLASLEGRDIANYLSPIDRVNEICVLPKGYPGPQAFSSDDFEEEEELCGLNFWGKSIEGKDVVICPKISSTNPGVEVYELEEGVDPDEYQSTQCRLRSRERNKDLASKKAKFKQSLSCSYSPSVLSYYQVSRLLGGIGRVPPAVVRSMGKGEHLELARFGWQVAKHNFENTDYSTGEYDRHREEMLVGTWGTFLWLHSNLDKASSKTSSRYSPIVFAEGNRQIWGALQKNVKGEENYDELFITLNNTPTNAHMREYVNNPLVAPIFNNTDLAGKSFEEINRLKDISDMLLLDYLLSQQDRMKNISYQKRAFFLDKSDGLMKSKRIKKSTNLNEIRSRSNYPIEIVEKAIILIDNDCGLVRYNFTEHSGILNDLRLISEQTLRKLIELSDDLENRGFREVFLENTQMLASDYSGFKRRLDSIITASKSKCASGQLRANLNPERMIQGLSLEYSDSICQF